MNADRARSSVGRVPGSSPDFGGSCGNDKRNARRAGHSRSAPETDALTRGSRGAAVSSPASRDREASYLTVCRAASERCEGEWRFCAFGYRYVCTLRVFVAAPRFGVCRPSSGFGTPISEPEKDAAALAISKLELCPPSHYSIKQIESSESLTVLSRKTSA